MRALTTLHNSWLEFRAGEPESVIVARHPDDGYVCKRVERVGRKQVELASLEPGRPPIVIPRDSSLVLGTVLLVWCTHRG